ncbi:MAG: DEAD/DEAH box helicase family protein [Saprospiraceae bacterium]|nr:DEAD/DEAH box helicase family protein [Saprospiraceae bacterium]
MAKRQQAQIDFPFYIYLQQFYRENRKSVRKEFDRVTNKFLDFNDPEGSPTAFLRRPQFEALEVYIFLKEFLDNENLHLIFEKWYQRTGRFEGRVDIGVSQKKGKVGSLELFGPSEFSEDPARYKEVFEYIKLFNQIYPNYIFALTMGLGKTVLMATSIFYEFILANKYPKDLRYCHNALVFAPDKTVLYSLKEIETFDKSKVVPPEYLNWLETHLKFHFLDESGDSLNAIDKTKYNIVISNTQKIILKRQHKSKNASALLFSDMSSKYKALSLNKDLEDLYGFEIDSEVDLATNQRFAKLTRLEQLGIYVDEAHHVFGNQLAADFGLKKTSTSLRLTINELAENLKKVGNRVVGCYNYTGTPYVGSRLLPEVVYAFGLRDAIENKYLKRVNLSSFSNIKDETRAFIGQVVREFWNKYGEKRTEGMLPKVAFFASTIEELTQEVRPAVEAALIELGIPVSKILVNVGDNSITSQDDIRDFRNLDSAGSNKQFILLVNKGKEGWNCRSLFGVALHRVPKSKVFVLQATMRCLRAIGDAQETGQVWLSKENVDILRDELQENFKISIEDMTDAGDKSEPVEVRVVPPPVKIKISRIRKVFTTKEKTVQSGVALLEKFEEDHYTQKRTEYKITDLVHTLGEKEVSYRTQREFSEIMLVAEISRYLNLPCLKIRDLLYSTAEGMDNLLSTVNQYNRVLYDQIIPALFNALYEIETTDTNEELEVELIKQPKDGYYKITAKKELLASMNDPKFDGLREKSFHLDHYAFDSIPEQEMFLQLLAKKEKVWFTGMLTHGQSDFKIHYVDPVSHTLRSYYPDFVIQEKDGSYTIIEVKGDHMFDDAVIEAKAEYAKQMATAAGMRYWMVKSSEVGNIHDSELKL